MKNFKYAFLLVVFISALLVSCSDDDNPVSDVGGKKPWVALTGTWNITSDDDDISGDIAANEKTVTMDAITFTGSWSGTTFKGSYTLGAGPTAMKFDLNVTVKSTTSISGFVKTTMTAAGQTNTDTNNFTGTRLAE